MRIAIIGTGSVGAALARGLAGKGHAVTLGTRVLKEVTPAGRWLISAGLIDGPTGKRIIRNLWEQSKPDWYDLPAVAP
jgi:2-polyprenyl-6-methoxyphenol hydroxylase-like FAD-dependent oxidoreductase